MVFWSFFPRGKRHRKVADDGSQPTKLSVATGDNSRGQDGVSKENGGGKSKGVSLNSPSTARSSPAPAPATAPISKPDSTPEITPSPSPSQKPQSSTSPVQTMALAEPQPPRAPDEARSSIILSQSHSSTIILHPQPRGPLNDEQKPPNRQYQIHYPAATTPNRTENAARSPLSNIPLTATSASSEQGECSSPPPILSSQASVTTPAKSYASSTRRKKQKSQNSNDRSRMKKTVSQSTTSTSARPVRAASWSYSPTPSSERVSNSNRQNSSRLDQSSNREDRYTLTAGNLKHAVAEYVPDIDMEAYTFKINTFEALTPRPHVKCCGVQNPDCPGNHPPYGHGVRRHSARDRGMIIPPVKEEEKRLRMKELADHLDAGALREIMERDQRRRELKRQKDLEKKERRMQKRAEAERKREEEEARNDDQAGPSSQITAPRRPFMLRTQSDSQYSWSHASDISHFKPWMASASAEGISIPPSLSLRNSSNPRGSIRIVNPQTPQRPFSEAISPFSHTPSQRLSCPPPVSHTSLTESARSPETVTSASPHASTAFSSRIASFFRRGSYMRRKSRQIETNQQPEIPPPPEISQHERQSSSSFVPPEPRGFSVPSRESFKNNPPSQILTPPHSIDRSNMTPSPSVKRMHSKFTELLDFPIPNESMISRLSSSEAVSQTGVVPPGSRASASEVKSNKRNEAEESSICQNLTDRSAVASPEPISEECEATAARDIHRGRRRQAYADQESSMIVPSNDSVALAKSLASIDSEGSWFSPKVSRSLSVKTARTQAQIERYKAGSPREGDMPKKSVETDISRGSGIDFGTHHEDDNEEEEEEEEDEDVLHSAKSSRTSMLVGEVNIREGANKGERVVVHPSIHHMAHASQAEISSTYNDDEEDNMDSENCAETVHPAPVIDAEGETKVRAETSN